MDLSWFAAALAVVFLINLAPALMPASWMVLTFFYVKADLPLIPLAVAGAICSGLGRYCLARESEFVTRTFFRREEAELRELGEFLERKRAGVPLVVFLYALTPLPTNNLFVAAGMVSVNIWRVLAGFWAARIPADLFWIWTTNRAFSSLEDVLEATGGNWTALLLHSLSITSIVALYVLPWGRWARRLLRTRGYSPTGRGRPTQP